MAGRWLSVLKDFYDLARLIQCNLNRRGIPGITYNS